MTTDDCLNQLEPVIAEAITILDRHTNQLKRLTLNTDQLVSAVTQQSENISFLLHQQLDMRGKQEVMDGKLDQILQLLQKPGQ